MTRPTLALVALAAGLAPHAAVADSLEHLIAKAGPHFLGAGLPDCPKVFVAKWQRGWDMNAIPAKKCLLHSDSGGYVCIRDKGCLRLGPYDENGNPQ
jgi:hypothetical protein